MCLRVLVRPERGGPYEGRPPLKNGGTGPLCFGERKGPKNHRTKKGKGPKLVPRRLVREQMTCSEARRKWNESDCLGKALAMDTKTPDKGGTGGKPVKPFHPAKGSFYEKPTGRS